MLSSPTRPMGSPQALQSPLSSPQGGFTANQVVMHQSSACLSASSRLISPSYSMMAARSSKNTCQSSADHPSFALRSNATTPDLWRDPVAGKQCYYGVQLRDSSNCVILLKCCCR